MIYNTKITSIDRNNIELKGVFGEETKTTKIGEQKLVTTLFIDYFNEENEKEIKSYYQRNQLNEKTDLLCGINSLIELESKMFGYKNIYKVIDLEFLSGSDNLKFLKLTIDSDSIDLSN